MIPEAAMAARRSNKRRRKQGGRFGGLYKLMSFFIILVVIVVGCVVFFRVEEITVVGQSQYTVQEVIDASGIEKGDNLFGVNKIQSTKRILASLPYVDEVNIRRVLPDGLILSVTECVPAALIRGENSWWVADSKGKLLEETTASARAGLATVTGITALLPATGTRLAVNAEESAKLQALLDVMSAFSERGMADKVSAVDLTGNANLTLTYDGRFQVKLPLSTNFPRMARALEEVVTKLQPNEKGTILMTQGEKEIRFIAD
ncbi:MAG: FtsQ-type POTRA domain-containing protein [Clostridia bacterium]|nr:FtsQ-type POTRA domain-containing protein [Clostridia bacterium]